MMMKHIGGLLAVSLLVGCLSTPASEDSPVPAEATAKEMSDQTVVDNDDGLAVPASEGPRMTVSGSVAWHVAQCWLKSCFP